MIFIFVDVNNERKSIDKEQSLDLSSRLINRTIENVYEITNEIEGSEEIICIFNEKKDKLKTLNVIFIIIILIIFY